MPTLRALLAFSFVVLGGSSCAAPLQNGGVVVSPRAEARLEVMCRYRASDAQQVCTTAEEEE